MSYKLVAIDMDDTLLDDNQQISSRNQEAIDWLLTRGVHVVLASGRPFGSLAPYARKLGIVLPLVTANGSLLKCSLTDKIYHKAEVELELAQEIIGYAQDRDYQISIYYEDRIITNYSQRAKVHRELQEVNSVVLRKDITLEQAPIKLLLHRDSPQTVAEEFEQLKTEYQENLYVTSAGAGSIEVMKQGINKGAALELIINRLGINSQDVMAIGNADNDLPMFRIADLAVAMGNSSPRIQEQADFVTKSNQEDGVAYALEKFIIN